MTLLTCIEFLSFHLSLIQNRNLFDSLDRGDSDDVGRHFPMLTTRTLG